MSKHNLIFLERYKQIPVLFLRLQFLELQTDLLLEFHQDLTQAVDGMSATPISKRYMAYLNAANYISSLLKVWGEETVSQLINIHRNNHCHGNC